MRQVCLISLVVRNYDEAIAFYCGSLGFDLVEDTKQGDDRRWVVVRPENGPGILLAQAKNERELAAIGNQTGGRVALFLETDDFMRDYAAFVAAGVRFREQPRHEAYGIVAVFEDLYGTLWDLIEHKKPNA